MNTLFQPYRLNDTITLANRFMMAPMTRCMAGPGLVPTAQMAAYYARRADIGLIISEAIVIRPDGQGFPNTPGIFTQAQIDGWKNVTSAVHAKGGKIFAQLWHVGRVSHSFFHGQQPVAPSAIGLEGQLPRMRDLSYPVPRALEAHEIKQLVADFAQAAANAMSAGFDGVEVHGANGYLIDQFLHYSTNLRSDNYGGTPENMSRFALEVVDAVNERIGAQRVGIRLAPGAFTLLTGDERDRDVFDHLLQELAQRKLAYVHQGSVNDAMTFDYLGGRASDYLRAHYQGNLVGVGCYSAESAAEAIAANRFDLVAIGRPLIANPDYLSKVKSGEELVPYADTMLAELV